VYVKGTGIIDKRSFVEPAPPAAAAADDGPPAAGGGSSFPFGWMAVAVLAVAALVVLWQVAGRSRRGGAAGAT